MFSIWGIVSVPSGRLGFGRDPGLRMTAGVPFVVVDPSDEVDGALDLLAQSDLQNVGLFPGRGDGSFGAGQSIHVCSLSSKTTNCVSAASTTKPPRARRNEPATATRSTDS